MSDNSHESTDRGGTTRRHADKPVHNTERMPRLVVVVATLAFVVGLANFALGHARFGVDAAIIGLLGFGAGLSWLAMDGRRIRQAEREWPFSNPAR